MTLAAALSLVACVVELGVGLLGLSMSGTPGWRHLRLLAFLAFTAAVYSASDVPQTLTESASVIVPAGRISLAAIALHLAGWVAYSAPAADGRLQLARLDRGLIAVLGLTAALSLLPGVLAAPRVQVHDVPWLGLRYATAEPTALAEAAFLFFFAVVVLPAARFVRQVRTRTPGALAQALGFAALLATGVNEALVAAGSISTPYLLDLGFLAVVIPITGEVSRRLVVGARQLADRSVRLEADVAARTRALADARQALEESERSYAEIFEATREAFAVHDLETGRVVAANQALADLTGWSHAEILDGTARPFDGAPPYSATEAAELMRRAVQEGPQRFEWMGRHRDGRPNWTDVQLVATRIRGRPSVLASMRDMTEHKRATREREQLQEKLLQAQKMESIGRLAGGVAHDFNNVLTVILGCCNAIQDDLSQGAPASAEDVAEIRLAAERARDVTRQLLAFARKQVIAPVDLDLNEVVRGSERLLKRVLGEDIQKEVELQADAWAVHCDPGQVEQMILNLALNARDAMPRGGTLTIETRNVPSGTPPDGAGAPRLDGDWVLLAVGDTGSGMSPEVQAHIFEPFFTTKPTGAGTGLGLATVHGIVTQSGGRLQVTSGAGRGTTFRIYLPRARAPAGPVRTEHPAPTRGGSETILLVEDERAVREVAARALRSAGYRVLTAADGAGALDVVAREDVRLDILVTDVVMPGLDGRALAEEIVRRRGPLRVLYVSGYTEEVISHRGGILDPGVAFLEKPFLPGALLARVRAALDAP